MPLIDIIIDTNVLKHASNSNDAKQQQDSINLINYILTSTELLGIDEGFAFDGSNRSLIGSEYIRHLKNGMIGYSFLVKIFSNKQYSICSSRTPAHISKKINQCISNLKARDKTFLKIAYNSASKTLVTHDQEDFKYSKRKHIKDTFGITVVDACEVA